MSFPLTKVTMKKIYIVEKQHRLILLNVGSSLADETWLDRKRQKKGTDVQR